MKMKNEAPPHAIPAMMKIRKCDEDSKVVVPSKAICALLAGETFLHEFILCPCSYASSSGSSSALTQSTNN